MTALLEKKEAAEHARVHDFDHYSKSVWYQINKKHDRKSSSKQYEAEVAHDIENMFETMSKQTHAHSPLATKRSALVTIRKILKSICLHSSEVGSVVMKNIYGQMDHMIALRSASTLRTCGKLRQRDILTASRSLSS